MLISLSFAVSTRLEQNITVACVDGAKAQYLAEAGLNNAISQLRADAKLKFDYTDANISINGVEQFLDGVSSYTIVIEDEQRKINVHLDKMTNSTVLMLQNLGFTDQQIANLIDYQDSDDTSTTVGSANGIDDDSTGDVKDAPFETLQEIRAVADIGEITFNNIKAHITIYSYQDPNTINNAGNNEARCPINVNTASLGVLKAVLAGIKEGSDEISDTKADAAASAIIGQRPYASPDGWSKFNACIDSCVPGDIIQAEADIIKDNCNPNRVKPSTYTTDFCFFSGGKYTLVSTGTLYNPADAAKKLAEKKLESVVDIYGILNQTKKSQFQGSEDDTEPKAFQVTTFDSCPVESIDSSNSWELGSTYTQVSNAIKNGFWDNMDDSDSDDLFYVDTNNDGIGEWMQATTGNRLGHLWKPRSDSNTIKDEDSDKNNELVFVPNYLGAAPITTLGVWNNPPLELKWANSAVRCRFSDGLSPYTKWRRWEDESPPADFCQHRVVMHLSRYEGWPKDNEVRMNQEYGGPPAPITWGQCYTRIGNNHGWKNNAYYLTNTSITVSIGNNDYYAYFYKQNDPSEFYEYAHDTGSFPSSGPIGWYADRAPLVESGEGAWADNVRIIPETSYFESKPMTDATISGDVSWGTITGTVILSSGGDYDIDMVSFQTKTIAGWSAVSGDSITSSDSTSIQYKAIFTTLDNPDSGVGTEPYFSETIALEDIHITYLPPAEILHYTSSCF